MTRSCRLRMAALARLAPALIVLAASVGCGGDGTHRVSGTVTYKGNPVPAGKIYFSPDGLKGNAGGTGYADIKDGKYDTSWPGGRGAAGGPSVAAIEGFDPAAPVKRDKADTSGEVTTTSLFPRYEVTLDISGVTSKNFEVPAAAAKPKKGTAPNGIIP